MIQYVVKFQKSSLEERREGIIRLQVYGDLDPLKQYVTGHQDELYRLELKYNNKRSLPQNARFHAMATEWGKAVGHTMDEAKAILKHRHGVVIPYTAGFVPPTRSGRFVELYGEIEFQVSTADYTKDEMAALMDGIERDIAEAAV